MWSELKDDKGRTRGGIFYKAAFYDRHAHMRLNQRYHASYMPEDQYKNEDMSYEERVRGKWFGAALDWDGSIIFETYHTITDQENHYTAIENLREQAVVWLRDKHPDYENILAYWD